MIATIALTMSCRKVHVCTCTTTTDASGVSPVTTIIDTPKETKRQAERGECANTKSTSSGVMTMTTCKVE